MIKKLLIRFMLRFFPAALELECKECGRIVAPENVNGHNAYYHPGRVMEQEDWDNTGRVLNARAKASR